jgi:hypothetical protein
MKVEPLKCGVRNAEHRTVRRFAAVADRVLHRAIKPVLLQKVGNPGKIIVDQSGSHRIKPDKREERGLFDFGFAICDWRAQDGDTRGTTKGVPNENYQTNPNGLS